MTGHLILSVVAAVVVSTVTAQNRWFCQSYSCPAYTSQDMGEYEIRNYEPSNWVATSASAPTAEGRGNTRGMFGKLFSYIQGANANGERIPMTVPVLTKIENRTTDFQFTMMFYLPSANPPTPTDSSVFLVRRPTGQVYVKSFPSWFWPRQSTYWSRWRELKTNIGDRSLHSDTVFYKAGYNAPYDYFKRKQHEVWVDKTA